MQPERQLNNAVTNLKGYQGVIVHQILLVLLVSSSKLASWVEPRNCSCKFDLQMSMHQQILSVVGGLSLVPKKEIVRNDMKGLTVHIRYGRISVTLGSVFDVFSCVDQMAWINIYQFLTYAVPPITMFLLRFLMKPERITLKNRVIFIINCISLESRLRRM